MTYIKGMLKSNDHPLNIVRIVTSICILMCGLAAVIVKAEV